MKNKILLLIVLVTLALAFIACTSSEDCERIDVRVGIEVYAESGHATNYIADLQPGDVLYVCGD
jgi:hypothetical protein